MTAEALLPPLRLSTLRNSALKLGATRSIDVTILSNDMTDWNNGGGLRKAPPAAWKRAIIKNLRTQLG